MYESGRVNCGTRLGRRYVTERSVGDSRARVKSECGTGVEVARSHLPEGGGRFLARKSLSASHPSLAPTFPLPQRMTTFQAKMVEDGLVLAMVMIMSEQEDFGRLCATVRATSARAYSHLEASREICHPSLRVPKGHSPVVNIRSTKLRASRRGRLGAPCHVMYSRSFICHGVCQRQRP